MGGGGGRSQMFSFGHISMKIPIRGATEIVAGRRDQARNTNWVVSDGRWYLKPRNGRALLPSESNGEEA